MQKYLVPVKSGSKDGCITCVSSFYHTPMRGSISELEYNDLQRRFNLLQESFDALAEEKAFQSEAIFFMKNELLSLKEKLVPLAVEIAAENQTMLNAFALGVKEKDNLVSKNNAKDAKNFLLQLIIGKEKFDALTELSLQKRYGTSLTTQNQKWKRSITND